MGSCQFRKCQLDNRLFLTRTSSSKYTPEDGISRDEEMDRKAKEEMARGKKKKQSLFP